MNRLQNHIQTLPLITTSLRRKLLRLFGVSVENSTVVYPYVFFGSNKCTLKSNVFLSIGCFVDGADWVRIGKNVHVGPHVKFITSSHEVGGAEKRSGRITTAPIDILDGCWIGAAAIILPGVKIAKGCVIAAGAVVNKDTEENGMYAGVPAVRIKNLPT